MRSRSMSAVVFTFAAAAILARAHATLVGARATFGGQAAAPRQPTPTFRSGVNLVLVDVVVRDRTGAVVKGLAADDFELLEDGTHQQILTFAFEDIRADAAPIDRATTLTAAVAGRSRPQTGSAAGAAALAGHVACSRAAGNVHCGARDASHAGASRRRSIASADL